MGGLPLSICCIPPGITGITGIILLFFNYISVLTDPGPICLAGIGAGDRDHSLGIGVLMPDPVIPVGMLTGITSPGSAKLLFPFGEKEKEI